MNVYSGVGLNHVDIVSDAMTTVSKTLSKYMGSLIFKWYLLQIQTF